MYACMYACVCVRAGIMYLGPYIKLCRCVYVCVHVCKYVCTCVKACAFFTTGLLRNLQEASNHVFWTCIDQSRMCVCVCVYVCMYVCMYVHRYESHVCVCVCMYVCICVRTWSFFTVGFLRNLQ